LPVSIQCLVRKDYFSVSLEANEEAVTRDVSGEVKVDLDPNVPCLTLPTLTFRSFFLDGKPAADQAFCWRLEGELVAQTKRPY
jgi:hypothetical protein